MLNNKKGVKSLRTAALILIFSLCLPVFVRAQHTAFQEWAVIYDSSDHDPFNPNTIADYANVITVAANGDVYVGVTMYDTWLNGQSYYGMILKYDSERSGGQYAGVFNGRITAMVLDSLGNLYVTGWTDSETNADFATSKILPDGTVDWTSFYDRAGDMDFAVDIGLDAAGSVYVTGKTLICSGMSCPSQITTVKYNSAGIEQWDVYLDNSLTTLDHPTAMAVDAGGLVYVTGTYTAKYNSSGTELCKVYSSDGYDIVPAGGGTFVTTNRITEWDYTWGSEYYSHDSYRTIKYDTNCVEQWGTVYDYDQDHDTPSMMEIDSSGNVYVAGRSCNYRRSYAVEDDCPGGYSMATVAYNSSGIELWDNRFSSAEEARALRMDADGNVYVMGNNDSIYAVTPSTVKIDGSNGEEVWSISYETFSGSDDEGADMDLDAEGNVYIAVTYNSQSSGLEQDVVTVKYSQLEDLDEDGVPNEIDNCPSIANTDQLDGDSDGYGDACDNCPQVSNPYQEDSELDYWGQVVGDGYGDVCDNCPAISNDQSDVDSDNRGDECDNCPDVFNDMQEDADTDNRGDVCDNCPATSNWNQKDSDGDALGDVCDPDDDNDGIADGSDNCRVNPNGPVLGTCTSGLLNFVGDPCTTVFNCGGTGFCSMGQEDTDRDGTGDACNDADDPDGDEWSNALDNCPDQYNPDQRDSNGDGIGGVCETDLTVRGVEFTQAVQFFGDGYCYYHYITWPSYITCPPFTVGWGANQRTLSGIHVTDFDHGSRCRYNVCFQDNDVPLVFGKPTLLRVYLDVGEAGKVINNVTASFRFTNKYGQPIQTWGPIWPNGPDPRGFMAPDPPSISAQLPDSTDHNDSSRTLNFYIDGNWYWLETPYVYVKVSSPEDVNTTNNEFIFGPFSRKTINLNVMFVRVNPRGRCITPNSDDFFEAAQYLRKIYPISSLNVWQHETVISWCFDPTDWGGVKGATLLGQIKWLNWFTDDPLPDMKYYGMVCADYPCDGSDPFDCGVSGMGWGDESWGIRAGKQRLETLGGETLAHELGHTLLGSADSWYEFWPGHVQDKCDAHGPFFEGYPNPYGLIDTTGYDVSGEILKPFTSQPENSSFYDIMTYSPCDYKNPNAIGTGRWISAYIYTRLLRRLESGGAQTASTAPTALAEIQTYLGATGVISPVDTLASLELRTLDMPVGTDDDAGSGPYSLELQDQQGRVLFERGFDLYDVDGIKIGFAELLPYQVSTSAIILKHEGTILDTVSVSAHAPQVSVTYPNGSEVLTGVVAATWTASDLDGDTLTYDVLYSPDGGITWRALALGVEERTVAWDTGMSPGSSSGLLKVQANDGVNHGVDTSDGLFSVVGKVPKPVIVFPPDGSVFFRQELIQLEGEAYDVEDGVLEGTSLQWSSSIDGWIGSGHLVALNGLSSGTHTITLIAQDSDSQEASATTTLRVALALDSDGDGVGDGSDNCRFAPNPLQKDADEDGIGDLCDDDDADGDGFPDYVDNCLQTPNDQKDSDWDGIGDVCDLVDDSRRIYLPLVLRNSHSLSVLLGETNDEYGLVLDTWEDRDTEVVHVGTPPLAARRTGNGLPLPSGNGNQIPDFYMQFNVDDTVLYETDPTTRVQVDVLLFDYGTDCFTLEYDGHTGGPLGDGRFKQSDTYCKTNTEQFKIFSFVLDEVYFGNRDNGADFRIFDNIDGAETIKKVTVRLLPPAP